MSNALARLRRLTQDPLLVRTSRGMELTPRAMQISECVRPGLSMLEEIFAHGGPFDPGHAEGLLTIAMTDALATLLAPRLLAHFDEHAPHLEVNVQRVDPVTLPKLLGEGDCDLALGYLQAIPERMYAVSLLSQSLSVIQNRRNAPAGRRFGLRDYLALRHVFIHGPKLPHAWPDATLTETLNARGLSRKVGAHVNSILLAPEIVASSSMLCTMPSWLARKAAASLPLAVHPLPFKAPAVTAHLIWHERAHRRNLHQWARSSVRDVVSQVSDGARRIGGVPYLE